MMAIATQLEGQTTLIADEDIRQLGQSLSGSLIEPADPDYDEHRKIWNAMIDRKPALIARCADTGDVVRAVDFARSRDLLVAIRAGGHNVAGNAVCGGGLVIDLSGMKGIQVDAEKRTAKAQPGLTWGEFDQATHAYGLAGVGGIQSTTGIAGFTIGGGIGWLSRGYGLTCDNLLSAEVVTADGKVLQASERENEDLFWGIRGGGGNFGVVTSFEFRLHRVENVLGGMVIHRLEHARDVLRFYRDFVPNLPDNCGSILFFVNAPAAPFIPAPLQGQPIVGIGICYAGDPAEGEELLKPLREFGKPEVDIIDVKPYTQLQVMTDPSNPPGQQNYWKAEYIRGLSDEALDVLIDFSQRRPAPLSKILVTLLGGQIAKVPENETAFSYRDPPFICNIMSMFSDPGQTEKNIAWARDLFSAMQPFSAGGVYVNFLSNEGDERIRHAYKPETYDRLVALKSKYDPSNFFRLNQNIKPRVVSSES